MAILDNLGKKLTEVTQTTVQVSKGLMDSAKTALAISAEEREIEKAYRSLGQWYYATKGQNPEEAGEYIDIVDTSLRKIREIREEAEAAQAVEAPAAPLFACPACGAQIEHGVQFCPVCGAMMPAPEIVEREESICPSCGALAQGPFCSRCGAQVVQVSKESEEPEEPEADEESDGHSQY